MADNIESAVIQILESSEVNLTGREKRVLESILKKTVISRDTHRAFYDDRTLGQRTADKVAVFGGSWTFIIIFGAILAFWVILNSYVLSKTGDDFDPFPYILLNLFLSMLAAIQAPIIMMSQNRQAAKDRLQATHDYEVNLKAELEILSLHGKLDELRRDQWEKLVAMQQEQLLLLTRLLDQRRPPAKGS